MTEYSDCLFLAVVRLADTGPFRPRIAFRTGIRQLRHHFQLYHGFAAVADGSADAVVAGVAAADDNNVLILGADIITIGQIGTDKALCGGFQEIHRIVDAVCIPSFGIDISRIGRTARQDHSVVILEQLLCGDILAYVYAGAELYALFLHHIHTALYHCLFQFHVGDAVHQQTAHTVFPFEHGDMMSTLVQLQSCRQTRRTGADNCHTLSGADFRRIRLDMTACKCLFNDGIFIFLDCDRIAVQSAGAGLFTQRRADTGGELRETVGEQQTVCRLVPEPVVNHVVPLRAEIVQRTSGDHAKDRLACLAERHTAVHAACALFAAFFVRKRRVKFTIGLDSLQRLLSGIFDSLIFEKSSCFSHDSPSC